MSAEVSVTSRSAQMSVFCTLWAATSADRTAIVDSLSGSTRLIETRAPMSPQANSLLNWCDFATAGSTWAWMLPRISDGVTISALLFVSLIRFPTTSHGSGLSAAAKSFSYAAANSGPEALPVSLAAWMIAVACTPVSSFASGLSSNVRSRSIVFNAASSSPASIANCTLTPMSPRRAA